MAEAVVTPSAPSTLLRPVMRGAAWNAAAQISDQVLRLTVGVALARLLGPVEFGVAAMAAAIAALGTAFADAAMGSAVVQRARLSQVDLNTAFWCATGAGLLLTLLGVATAPLVAALYGEPRVAGVFAAMMVGTALTGAASTHIALLARALRFRTISLVMFSGQLLGAAAGLFVAFNGGGAWAIVAQGLCSTGLVLVLAWCVMSWRPGLRISRTSLRELGSFSGALLGSRLFFYGQRYADNLIVGARLGSAALAGYALAYNLMMLPFQRIVDPLRAALLPALARVQDDLPRVRSAWLRCTRAVMVLLIPMLLTVMVVADDLLRVVLGERWLVAAGPLRVLAVVGVLQSTIGLNSLVLTALGHAGALLRFSIVSFVLSLPAFLIGARWGTVGVSVGYLIATAAIVPLYLRLTARVIELRAGELLRALSGVFQVSLGVLVCVLAVQLGVSVPPPAQLALSVLAAGAAWFGFIAWRAPELIAEARTLRARVKNAQP